MFKKLALIIFLGMTALAVIVALKSDREVTTSSQEAYKHYLAGRDYFDKFYLRSAVDEFEQAVKLDSNFAMAQARLAMAYASRGFAKKGKEMQKAALANRHLVSKREQLTIDVWEQEWEGNSDSAYALAKQFVAAYPKNVSAVSMMAGMEFAHNNWEQSLQYYQRALELQPDYAPAYNMLGYINFYLGRYDDALRMLDKYLQYAKDQANPHDSRGEILYATGRYEEAIDAFRQAYNINPEFDVAITHMAASYNELGQMSQVDYCYQILLRDAPNERSRLGYLTSYARTLAYRDDYDSATTLCRYVIDNDPELAEGGVTTAPYLLGLIYYREHDAAKMNAAWDSARVIMAHVVAKMPETRDFPFHERMNTLMAATTADLAGDLDSAAALFEKSIDMVSRPDDKFYYRIYYADVLQRDGKHDLAVSELQKNLSVNPNHAPTLIHLADIYEDNGDKASAQAYRQKALKVWGNADPDFKPAQKLRDELGRAVSAQRDLPGNNTETNN
jgi:tetratricopeptide (TPR) repeat protein